MLRDRHLVSNQLVASIDVCIAVLQRAPELPSNRFPHHLLCTALRSTRLLLVVREHLCSLERLEAYTRRVRILADVRVLVGTSSEWVQLMTARDEYSQALSAETTKWATILDEVQSHNRLSSIACLLDSRFAVCFGDLQNAEDLDRVIKEHSVERASDGSSLLKRRRASGASSTGDGLQEWLMWQGSVDCQEMELTECTRFGPEILEMLRCVFRWRHSRLNCALVNPPPTQVVPILFQPLSDWECHGDEVASSQQLFAQLATPLAFEVVRILTAPSVEARCGAIRILGYRRRVLQTLQEYLRHCLHDLCWPIYEAVRATDHHTLPVRKEEFMFQVLQACGTVKLDGVDVAEGCDAPVVFYCCHRRSKDDVSWAGQCLCKRKQFVGLTRARLRLYILIEDFSSTTMVGRNDPLVEEACTLGARVCRDARGLLCKQSCSECSRLAERIILLRLVNFCRGVLVRRGCKDWTTIRTASTCVSDHGWANPLSRILPGHRDLAQEVYNEAWWAYHACEWAKVIQHSNASEPVQQTQGDEIWFHPREMVRGSMCEHLLRTHPPCNTLEPPSVLSESILLEPWQIHDRGLEATRLTCHWEPFKVDALSVHIRQTCEIIVTVPFAPSLTTWRSWRTPQRPESEEVDKTNMIEMARVLSQETYARLHKQMRRDNFHLSQLVTRCKTEDSSGEADAAVPAFVVEWRPDGPNERWDTLDAEEVLHTYCPNGQRREHPLQKCIVSTGLPELRRVAALLVGYLQTHSAECFSYCVIPWCVARSSTSSSVSPIAFLGACTSYCTIPWCVARSVEAANAFVATVVDLLSCRVRLAMIQAGCDQTRSVKSELINMMRQE